MSRHHGEVQLDQNGSAGGGHNTVVGCGRHAHAQHDAAQHGQHQADDGNVARHLDDGIDEDRGQAGNGNAAGNDTRHTAGHSHSDSTAGTGFQRIHRREEGLLTGTGQRLAGRLRRLLFTAPLALQEEVDEANGNGRQNRISGRMGHGLAAGGHQPNQQNQRDDQIAITGQYLPLGQLVTGNAFQAQLLGLQMDGDKDSGEVQNGRQDGLNRHLRIGDLHVFRHQKRSRAHDGRHDLAAGGGGSFHCAGKLRLVASLFHHGNGERSGGNGIAHRGAGHHAAQGGADHGHLGGTTAGPTGNTVSEADEEIGNAGALQKRTEDDEQNDIGIANVDRRADDTGSRVKQLIDNGLESVIQRCRIHCAGIAELVDESVNDQRAGHAKNGHAHAAAAQLHQDQHTNDADHDMYRLNAGGQPHQRHGVECEIEEAACADDHQDNIIPRQGIDVHAAFFCRIGQKADDDDASHKNRQSDLRHGA